MGTKISDLEWILQRLDTILDSSSPVDVTRNAEKIKKISQLVQECKEEIGM